MAFPNAGVNRVVNLPVIFLMWNRRLAVCDQRRTRFRRGRYRGGLPWELEQIGAYVIFAPRRGGFVQFMSSPDGEEYLCEIQSYKFDMSGGECLDAEAVDLIEKAGFVWPTNKANFLRWFKSGSPEDIREMAEAALAAVHRLFHCRSVDELDVKSHIPELSA